MQASWVGCLLFFEVLPHPNSCSASTLHFVGGQQHGMEVHWTWRTPVLFTFTLSLCKHDVAVQTQPLASEKSGQFQESRVGKTALLLLAFPTPPTPPHPDPRPDCLSLSPWPPSPASLQTYPGEASLGSRSHCLGTRAFLFISRNICNVPRLVISSAALLLHCWSLCFVSPTKIQVL